MKIKARVWDIDGGKMSAGIDLDEFMLGNQELQFPDTNESLPFSDFLQFRKEYSDWMLWTGLLDKNKIEIYAGDIVKGVRKHNGQSEVFWDCNCFAYQPFSFLNTYNGDEFEVVANIYQP